MLTVGQKSRGECRSDDGAVRNRSGRRLACEIWTIAADAAASKEEV